jgi:hypothetical protein
MEESSENSYGLATERLEGSRSGGELLVAPGIGFRWHPLRLPWSQFRLLFLDEFVDAVAVFGFGADAKFAVTANGFLEVVGAL